MVSVLVQLEVVAITIILIHMVQIGIHRLFAKCITRTDTALFSHICVGLLSCSPQLYSYQVSYTAIK